MKEPQKIPLTNNPRHKEPKRIPLKALQHYDIEITNNILDQNENYSENNSESIPELESYETD
jgi:hypothetical protein